MEHVNHPKHYQRAGKECIQVMIETYGVVATICFCIINFFKYDWRAGEKEGNPEEQDHSKGEWYLKFAIAQFSRCTVFQKFRIRVFHRTVYKTIEHYREHFVYCEK